MSIKILVAAMTVVAVTTLKAQTINGVVLEKSGLNEVPLVGATVQWANTFDAVSTNQDGKFSIERNKESNILVIKYVGYKTDSINIKSDTRSLKILLTPSSNIDEIEIVVEQNSSYIDYANTRQVEIITQKELAKAACCNLAESFETNPSVDVSYTDAVSGTRQIIMLGLAGKYAQITREAMPNIRGLISNYGLTFIPGTWIQSIQITKGIGSVANGYESFTGQINIELQKPYDGDEDEQKFYFNMYESQSRRTEFNMNYGMKISEKFSNATLLHFSIMPIPMDRNKDGFMDNPIGKQFNAIHRWKYKSGNGHLAQLGVNAIYDEKTGGQTTFKPEDRLTTNSYGVGITSQKGEVWGKTAYVFDAYKSIGFQTSFSTYTNESFFGINLYNGNQQTIYNNLIYQTTISNIGHNIKTGLSFVMDNYAERFNVLNYERKEMVYGAFGEYTYEPSEHFTSILGLRVDYHNIIGVMVNPRFHLRYCVNNKTVFRASAGKGQRIANIYAENNVVFASSRQIVITPSASADARTYGLSPEEAWNMGLSVNRDFKINHHKGTITLDYYHNIFTNQVIIDMYQNMYEVHFYNLQGKSFSNSTQLEVRYEPFKRFEVKAAYRYYDVRSTFNGKLLPQPMLEKQRGFLNFAYSTKNKWSFDATVLYTGQKYVPFKGTWADEYPVYSMSPWFVTISGQITKSWKERFDLYVGVENLTDYRQDNPIFGSDVPFGPNFDAGLVWGPVFGRNIYVGLRYKI